MKNEIKKSFICKDIDLNRYHINSEKTNDYIPVAGDVGIFQVLSIGKHKRMQADSKLNVMILPGDFIMAAFGTRYATAQFEGYLPTDCRDIFHILGAGGTIGIIESMHASFVDIGPTILRLTGYVTDQQGQVINTRKQSEKLSTFRNNVSRRCTTILSIGSSMDSGKTTTAAYLARGLKKGGHKVAYIKLTGTVYTKDRDMVADCGAQVTADFSDYGFPSTYMCSEKELLDLFESLMNRVGKENPDYVIIEIADGILQRETKMLLKNKKFMSLIDHTVFSCGDSLSGLSAIDILKDFDIYPSLLSGLVTASPLLVKEIQEHTAIPVATIENLMEGMYNQLMQRKMKRTA